MAKPKSKVGYLIDDIKEKLSSRPTSSSLGSGAASKAAQAKESRKARLDMLYEEVNTSVKGGPTNAGQKKKRK